ncbi:MAG: GAF domain-containing protein [bacterium]
MPPSHSSGGTTPEQLAGRYERITRQLEELFEGYAESGFDEISRMATIAALLHHKMPHYFWTGFYRLEAGELIVGPYQGPLACAVLPGPDGVCWTGVRERRSIIVPDVHAFEGHVACDERSRSEIVVPVREPAGNVVGVLDVDSDQPDAFSEVDRVGLEKIVQLLFG